MYRILIVDDNPLIRMGMKNMIQWGLFYATLAGEAENGEHALQLVKELEPDLIITDIRMPGKGGLYLLDQIQKNYPEINTIVISAYDEFQYAKEALKAGSIDYILKPIDPEELNKAIKKAFNNKSSGIAETAEMIRSSRYDVIMALKPERNYNISDLSELEGIKMGKMEDLFFILCSEQNAHSIERLLSRRLKGCFLLGRQNTERGESPESLWRKAVYDAAGQILRKSHKQFHSYHGDCLNQEKIALYCTTGNARSLKEMFHGLIASALSEEKLEIGGFIKKISSFLQILMSIDQKTFTELRKLLDKVECHERRLVYFSLDELVYNIDEMIDRICQEYSRILGNKKDLVARVKDMVRKNYNYNISLHEIAQLFFVTPSYLSRLFKQETGTNLNNYITMIRMEKAKQLLEETDEKVNDIARMVGYQAPNYFARVFKKCNGYAPSDKRLK